MKLIKNKKNSLGFTLTEILLVLVIAAAIVISAFIIYPKVRNHNNANTLFTEIALIRGAVQEMYAGRPNYNGLSNQVLIDSGALPKTMIRNYQIYSQTGSPISVMAIWDDSYLIQISNLSNVACIKIVSNIYKSMGGMNTIQINSTGYASNLTLDKISTACSKNDYGTTTPDSNFVSIQMRD